MKKLFVIFLISFLFVFFPKKVSAKILTNKEGTVELAKNEIVNDDLIIGAKKVILNNTVNGDVFIGSEETIINGTINGNLHIGSGRVSLKGQIKGNVYIGTGNLTINKSTIGGSLLIGAGSAVVDNKSIIKGSVFAGVGSITIDSKINRNLYLGAGNASVQNNTKVGMDLYYAYNESDNKISISDKAVIIGKTHSQKYNIDTKNADTKVVKKQFESFKLATKFLSFISTLIIGFIFLKLFKKRFTESSLILSQQFWKSLGIGFLVFITFFPAILTLLISVVGIPLIGVSFLILFLFIYLSKFIVSLSLGSMIVKKFNWSKLHSFWVFTLGLVVFYLLKSVPVVGGFISFLAITVGLGALTINLFQNNK